MLSSKHALALFAGCLFFGSLISAGPTIVVIAHALIPLVLVVALAIAVLRLVWHYTNRDL